MGLAKTLRQEAVATTDTRADIEEATDANRSPQSSWNVT
jgi:hypothetical protein